MKKIIALLLATSLTSAFASSYIEEVELYPLDRDVVAMDLNAKTLHGESAIIAAAATFAASELGQAALKQVVKLGASGLKSYANKYEATYSAKTVIEDDRIKGPFLPKNPGADEHTTKEFNPVYFKFTRSLVFPVGTKWKQAAKELNLPESEMPIDFASDFKFPAFVGYFQVFAKEDVMRVIPLSISYKAIKAKRLHLPFTNKDEPKTTLTFTFRQAGEEPITAEITKSQSKMILNPLNGTEAQDSSEGKTAATFSTDWLPILSSGNYSFEVIVLETSDAKEWITKAATKAESWGNDEIEKLKKK